jgi:DNA-binding protein YbaB
VTSQDQLTGRGVAAGGRIVVTAQSGHIVRVELDPDILQLRPDALAEELTQAVNDALDYARTAGPALDPRDQVDLDLVAREFAAFSGQAAQRIQAIVSAIQDAVADLARDGKLPAGGGLPDGGRLLQQMERVAGLLPAAVAASPQGASSLQARASGQAGGLVRAVAVPPGRVGHLEVDPEAARAGSGELGGLVTGAVNMALGSLEQSQREQLAVGSARRAELKEQLQELNDAAVAQIQEFGSVASLLGGIRLDGAGDLPPAAGGAVTEQENGGRGGAR